MKLKAAEYKDVFLRQSVFQEQFERTVDRYLHLPNDSLLYNFRKRKYKTAPGRPLTGWYGRQSFNFGQFCGALAKMYAQTQNTEIKAKLLYLWNEWADCIEEDGYGFSRKRTDIRNTLLLTSMKNWWADWWMPMPMPESCRRRNG